MQTTAIQTRPAALTVAALARHKRLPADFLAELGVYDLQRGGVGIPYYGFDRKTVLATRLRTALSAKQGSYWTRGTKLTEAYGLWRLNPFHGGGDLYVAEGETNIWTLWRHRYPALGLPGASLAKQTLHCDALQNVSRIWAILDPGRSGEEFFRGVCAALGFCRYQGQLFTVNCHPWKDVSDIHVADPLEFDWAFYKCRTAAREVPCSQWLTPAALRQVIAEALRDPSPWFRDRLVEIVAPQVGELVAALLRGK